ncbi:hypothetical protein K474DRAFT_1661809 [Panus rudis PR-1116 ss-1]|nr:hypothetical protein K474DRAFT_1661809 [Panus rudis PR-1116 ss-1]
MSSAGKSFGTQSPSLEATGSAEPMGVSSISGEKPQAVSDKKQRGEYLGEAGDRANQKQEEESSVETEKLKKD